MALRQLRSALHAFTREAAWQLASDAGGDDLPFEVVESGRGVSPLYCYRPLTSDFIDAHGSVLSQLPTWLPAAHARSEEHRLNSSHEIPSRMPSSA